MTRPATLLSVGIVAGAAGMLVACMVTDAVLRRCIDALTVARARWELDGLDGVLDGWQQEAGA